MVATLKQPLNCQFAASRPQQQRAGASERAFAVIAVSVTIERELGACGNPTKHELTQACQCAPNSGYMRAAVAG